MGSFKVRLYVADLIAPKDSLILPSLYHIHAGIYTANELENRCAFLETPVKQLVRISLGSNTQNLYRSKVYRRWVNQLEWAFIFARDCYKAYI